MCFLVLRLLKNRKNIKFIVNSIIGKGFNCGYRCRSYPTVEAFFAVDFHKREYPLCLFIAQFRIAIQGNEFFYIQIYLLTDAGSFSSKELRTPALPPQDGLSLHAGEEHHLALLVARES